MFCFHKFGPEVDRKQTCAKCGLIRIVPCVHKWEVLTMRNILCPYTDAKIGEAYTLRCPQCGKIEHNCSPR